MHRAALLKKIKYYRDQAQSEHERICANQFEEFVRMHPNCFERSLSVGHITASAWLLDPCGERALLTHHKKLGKWLQLGGHADGDVDTLRVAQRELYEESGIQEVKPVFEEIFDLDIHSIPSRVDRATGLTEPEHLHYDVRFLFQSKDDHFVKNEESNALAWYGLNELTAMGNALDPSVQR